MVDAGSLMSYGTDQKAIARAVPVYVDKILKGVKPADLPVQQPSTYELAINLKTASGLGLIVPPIILRQTDEVVE
jgi:putative tryptophan/tyrosine transport system substrate-binding protein